MGFDRSFGFDKADVLDRPKRLGLTISRSLIAFLAVVSTVLDDTLYLGA
jgi:hypothetical protein